MYKSFSGNALADKMFLTVFKRLTRQSLSKHLTEKNTKLPNHIDREITVNFSPTAFQLVLPR